MGVYDSVKVPCPKCGEPDWFQSKGSGDAACREFELADAPEDVMSNVNRHSPHECEKCGQLFAVDEYARKPVPVEAGAPNWWESGINSWYTKRY